MPTIPAAEFRSRITKIQDELESGGLDGLAVYGDEYRKENLRYVSNFWPIFERGMCFIPRSGDPILAGAPEGEVYAREMCIWSDTRNIKEFACVTVPEEIEYPLAEFSSLGEIISETLDGGKRLGLVGIWDIPGPIMDRIREAVAGVEMVTCDDLLQDLRNTKSEAEIACLTESGRISSLAYEVLMEHAVPGATELSSSGAAEGAARQAGAEDITFVVYGSGERTNTIIGRPTRKIIEDGDMIMAALAVQYEGYVTTVEFPFVAGKTNDAQQELLGVLFEAANVQQKYLKAGTQAAEMVKAVKAVFKKHKMEEYDVYPPMHGIGLAEAESPYPDEHATYAFLAGTCVNSDISLFGHPAGSNRIEEGFVITDRGPLSLTPSIRAMCEKGMSNNP